MGEDLRGLRIKVSGSYGNSGVLGGRDQKANARELKAKGKLEAMERDSPLTNILGERQ